MDTLERSTAPAQPTPARWPFMLSGVLAAGAALAVGELISGLIFSVPSPVVGVADLVVESSPEAVQKWAIRTFGTADKLVLVVSILAVALLAGIAIGRRAVSSTRLGVAVIWGFAALAWLGLIRSAGVTMVLATATALIAGIVGVFAFTRLVALAADQMPGPETSDLSPASSAVRPDRRRFILGAGAVVAVAAASAVVGRWLSERARIIASSRTDVVLPVAAEVLDDLPPDINVAIDGVSPIITPNDEFYRIDTAISVPMVNLGDWSVSFSGLVDRPYSLTYDDLLAMDLVERDVTLCCVSNQIGGDLIGTARWLGVPLPELLDRAGVQDQGTQLIGRSVDGFTVGFPTELASDGRTALLAIGMNGEPLPFEHGFPARLVVSGLYGYVSATKWLSEIELAPWDAFDAYWIPRGWAKEAPIKTQSRIDTPRRGRNLAAGPVPIGGVAWAQNTGVARVEIQVDDSDWQEADLGTELSVDTWRQWTHVWDASDAAPGTHVIRVRATDSAGTTQTPVVASPRPDGATGHHEIAIQITS